MVKGSCWHLDQLSQSYKNGLVTDSSCEHTAGAEISCHGERSASLLQT